METRRFFRLGLLLLQALLLTACVPTDAIASQYRRVQPPTWRAAWVAAKSITSAEQIDQVLGRAQAAGLNRIAVNVFYNGETLFNSDLAPKYDKVDPGFDPLGYLVPKAHERGIKVDAWFLAGRVGDDSGSPVLAAHPEWGLIGPDGERIPWLNFVRPDVRQFIRDLMLQTVERYGVDGLQFDYIRFPGAQWGFDPYNIEAFTSEYGVDLNELRYADLPAYGFYKGNRLSRPSTGQVLASFSDGQPAVVLNRYRAGQVILLNWDADERYVAADSEILQRSIKYLLAPGGQVYLLHPQSDPVDYYGAAMQWLQELGWSPLTAEEGGISALSPQSVLVLSNVYSISSSTADALAAFVANGGRVILIDGPTKSIDQPTIQAITGMTSKSGYFSGYALIVADVSSPLLPVSQRTTDMESYLTLDAKWKDFRRRSISALLRDVFEQVTKEHPDVLISATITSDMDKAANTYLQDWSAWLQGGYVDFIVPRAYVEGAEELSPILRAWKVPMTMYRPRITLGLISYLESDPAQSAKPAGQLLTEIEAVREAGSNGVYIFDLGRMSDVQSLALRNVPLVPSP